MKKAKVSKYGQWKYPGEDTIIPNANGNITMQGVPYPVLGIDDMGNQQMMMPGMDYKFPGNSVYEIPMMGYGGDISIPSLKRVRIKSLPKAQTIGEFKPSYDFNIPPLENMELNRRAQAAGWNSVDEYRNANWAYNTAPQQKAKSESAAAADWINNVYSAPVDPAVKEQQTKQRLVEHLITPDAYDKERINPETGYAKPIHTGASLSAMSLWSPEDIQATGITQEDVADYLNQEYQRQQQGEKVGQLTLDLAFSKDLDEKSKKSLKDQLEKEKNNLNAANKTVYGSSFNTKLNDYYQTEQDLFNDHNKYGIAQSTFGPLDAAVSLPALSATLAMPILGTSLTLGSAVNPFFYAAGINGFLNPNSNFSKAAKSWSKGTGSGEDVLLEAGLNSLNFLGAKSLPSDIKNFGKAYKEIATGESIIPYAWKSRAMSITPGESKSLFDKIMNSGKFTNADKDLLRNYAVSSWEFKTSSLGKKSLEYQQRMRNLIEKAKVEFPEETILTRKFWMAGKDQPAYLRKESGNYAFDNVKFDKAGNPIEFSLQNRPGSFSAGQIGEGHGNDRIVLSGKNAKAVENNFAKQEYNPTIDPEYYKNLRKEDMIKRENIGINSVYDPMGDLHYGLSRIEPSKIAELAEAKYAQRVANVNTEARVKELTDIGLTKEDALKEVQEWMANNKQLTELYGNPANKEEALAKIIEEARNPKPFNQNMQNELEMIGTGFDMKVVGKVKNDIGGFDYIVKPKNIKAGTNTSTGTTGETLNSAENPNVSEHLSKLGYKSTHKQLTDLTDKLRNDRIKFWESSTGKARLEAVVENTPELKAAGITADDYISGIRNMTVENRTATNNLMRGKVILDERKLVAKELEEAKLLEQQSGVPHPNRGYIERLEKKIQAIDEEFTDIVNDYEKLRVNSTHRNNAYMGRREPAVESKLGEINLQKPEVNKNTRFTIGVGRTYDLNEAERVINHELGHLIQRGVKTNLDKELEGLDLLKTETTNLFNSANKDSNYFDKALNYFRSGSQGQEKLPFLEEVRSDMLQKGIIKDFGDDITEDMIKQHYANYIMEGRSAKGGLRIYDIMKNDPKNFSILKSVINKMPAVVIGTGVGYGMMNQGQDLPQKKFGGNIINTLNNYKNKFKDEQGNVRRDTPTEFLNKLYPKKNGGSKKKSAGFKILTDANGKYVFVKT